MGAIENKQSNIKVEKMLRAKSFTEFIASGEIKRYRTVVAVRRMGIPNINGLFWKCRGWRN